MDKIPFNTSVFVTPDAARKRDVTNSTVVAASIVIVWRTSQAVPYKLTVPDAEKCKL